MSKKITIFDDENPNQELSLIINEDRRLYIRVGDFEDSDNGWITLDKQDIDELIIELKRLKTLI